MDIDFKKPFITAVIFLLLSLFGNVFLAKELSKKSTGFMGGGSDGQYGELCLYTSSLRNIADGNGTSFACDSQGRLILAN